MGHTQLLSNLAQIARDPALVLHHGTAADYFQVGNLGQISQDFVLHSVGEILVLLFVAQIFKGQHSDAFFGHSRGRACRSAQSEEECGYNRRNHQ
jgi:hypothetical protein